MARRCTDVIWLILSTVALAGLVPVIQYARKHGDYRRIVRGSNANGELCGTGRMLDRPYLYYCLTSGGKGIDLKKPVCVASCPAQRGLVTACGSMGYSSTMFMDAVCVPTDEELLKQLANQGSSGQIAQKIAQMPRYKLAFAASVGVALVLGYCYLALLETCAGLIVWMCLTIILALPSFAGAYLIWVAKFQGGFDGIPDVGNDHDNFIVGVVLCSIAVLLLGVVCCSLESISTAIETVKVAADCITDEPSLLLGPLVDITFKLGIFVAMMSQFILLLSCGKVEQASGLYRQLKYTDMEKAYLVYFSVVIVWALEFFTASSHFAIAWASKKWYFSHGGSKKHAPCCGLPRGYMAGLFFHLGSLLLGSLLIALCRVARLVLQAIATRNQVTARDAGSQSAVMSVLACLVACFENFLAFITKNAFIEIAIKPQPFCRAARRALGVIASQAVAVGIVNGATWIIQVAGLGLIACGGAGVTWVLCWYVAPFNDTGSEHYVNDPVFVTVVGGIFSLIVALPFIIVFDTVSDTILYCLASDELGGGRAKLVGDESDDEPRRGSAERAQPPKDLRALIAERRGE